MAKFTRHHIKNKSRGGSSVQSNLLLLSEAHHQAWHSLFKDMTFDEVIELLTRIRDNKRLAKKFWRQFKDMAKI